MDSNATPLGQDMRYLVDAHRHVTPGGLPSIWTPEYVTERLIEAQKVLRRSPWGKGTPSGDTGSSWPSLLIDMAKATDHMMRVMIDADKSKSEREKAVILDRMGIAGVKDVAPAISFPSDLPSPDQVSRMEEALAWPMTYLRDHPRAADAITIYAYAQANKSFEIKPFMEERYRQASELAKRMSHQANAAPDQEPRRRRRHEIAVEIARTVNAVLLNVTSAEEAEETKRDARYVMRQMVKAEGLEPIVIAPFKACPEYCLTRDRVHRARKRAADVIAKGLRRDRIPLR